MKKKVVVIGMGFVGAPMSVVISSAKKHEKYLYSVCGLDKSDTQGEKKIQSLKKGHFPFEISDKTLKKK